MSIEERIAAANAFKNEDYELPFGGKKALKEAILAVLENQWERHGHEGSITYSTIALVLPDAHSEGLLRELLHNFLDDPRREFQSGFYAFLRKTGRHDELKEQIGQVRYDRYPFTDERWWAVFVEYVNMLVDPRWASGVLEDDPFETGIKGWDQGARREILVMMRDAIDAIAPRPRGEPRIHPRAFYYLTRTFPRFDVVYLNEPSLPHREVTEFGFQFDPNVEAQLYTIDEPVYVVDYRAYLETEELREQYIDRIIEIIKWGRYANIIPWTWITTGAEGQLLQARRLPRLADRARSAPLRPIFELDFEPPVDIILEAPFVVIWAEKSGFLVQFEPLLEKYYWGFFKNSGDISKAAVYQLYQRVKAHSKTGIVLVLTDFDQGGLNIPVAAARSFQHLQTLDWVGRELQRLQSLDDDEPPLLFVHQIAIKEQHIEVLRENGYRPDEYTLRGRSAIKWELSLLPTIARLLGRDYTAFLEDLVLDIIGAENAVEYAEILTEMERREQEARRLIDEYMQSGEDALTAEVVELTEIPQGELSLTRLEEWLRRTIQSQYRALFNFINTTTDTQEIDQVIMQEYEPIAGGDYSSTQETIEQYVEWTRKLHGWQTKNRVTLGAALRRAGEEPAGSPPAGE